MLGVLRRCRSIHHMRPSAFPRAFAIPNQPGSRVAAGNTCAQEGLAPPALSPASLPTFSSAAPGEGRTGPVQRFLWQAAGRYHWLGTPPPSAAAQRCLPPLACCRSPAAACSTMNKLARWSVMGRKDYNEALITVVKLSGVLQAFSGPARAPQVRGGLRGSAAGLCNGTVVSTWLELVPQAMPPKSP